MDEYQAALGALGHEPPMIGGARHNAPDRRELSARWMSGLALTAMTSIVLMGAALSAAVNGRIKPTAVAEVNDLAMPRIAAFGDWVKARRVSPPRQAISPVDRRRMNVSTIAKLDNEDVVRSVPFVHVKMALAAGLDQTLDYPSLETLDVFAEDEATLGAGAGLIYGATVESDVSLRTIDFPFDTAVFEESTALSAVEAEQEARVVEVALRELPVGKLRAAHPLRFGVVGPVMPISAAYRVRIVPENVSISSSRHEARQEFSDEVISIDSDRSIADAFASSGHSGGDAMKMAAALAGITNTTALKAGRVLRIGALTRSDQVSVVRASVYENGQHSATVALNDRNEVVAADEPDLHPAASRMNGETQQPVQARADLPKLYDAIYRAAVLYGLTPQLTRQLIRLLSTEVDYEAKLDADDRLDVFFSNPGENDRATEQSELYFVRSAFGGSYRTFYRHETDDGAIEYFGPEGRSADQFLLRNPVPDAKFESGFGMRRHPILGYSRMHTGVDWSAPQGTPILASGDGVVEETGWQEGYGLQTLIRHPNGYATSYSHQSAIADGIVAGGRVQQGDIIGFVGATGLATGNHLHYEVIVNDAKVDPMRIRLPDSRILRGSQLDAFLAERDRMDTLLYEDGESVLSVAGDL